MLHWVCAVNPFDLHVGVLPGECQDASLADSERVVD